MCCNFFDPPRGQVVKKCFLEKALFAIFCRFYGLTSDAIFSVICPCRMLFNTIFENYKEKSFQKWLDFVSRFWKWSQNVFLKTIFDDFCQFFGPTFLSHLLILFCEVGPQCPLQELEGRARRALNF